MISSLGGMEPCIYKVDKPGIQTDRLLKLLAQTVSFGSLQPFTVRKIPSFLSALASNNAFIVKVRCGLAEPLWWLEL